MNMLSLRVSSVKSNENIKKNSDYRMEIMKLPQIYDENSYESSEFIKYFKEANSIEDQVKVVRNIASDLTGLNIQFLCDLFFEAPLKHPVKQTSVKLLQNCVTITDVKTCLGGTIKSKLQQFTGTLDLNKLNDLTNSLSSCLENFPPGNQAVRQQINLIIQFLIYSIKTYMNQLNTPISPATKNEYCIFLHNSIRLLQSCVQQFNIPIDDIDIIFNIIEKNVDIPMDTHINCGSIITLNYKINKKFNEFINDKIKFQDNLLNLCLNIGFINSFELDDLCDGYIELYDSTYSLIEHARLNANESTIILAVARGLFQLSKKFILYFNNIKKSGLNNVLELLLKFSLTHLEHYMDSVRHLSKDLLKNLTQFTSSDNSNNIFNQIVHYSNHHNSILIKCNCLNSLTNVIGVEKIFQLNGDSFVENLVLNIDNLTILQCCDILMMKNLKEIEINVWYNRWIKPLIKLFNASNNSTDIFEIGCNLIKKSAKENTLILDLINTQPEFSNQIALKLSCYGSARKKGHFDSFHSNNELWKNFLLYKDLDLYSISNDDNISIACFRLLAESHKTTELFEEKEFEIILKFLEFNINCQSPSIRQQILSYSKIILLRLSAIVQVLKRNRNEEKLKSHLDFIEKLYEFCLLNLYVNGNYSRRVVSLKVLIQIVGILCELKFENKFWKKDNVRKLLKSLDDTYEGNKGIIIDILELSPRNGGLLDHSDLISFNIVYELASSIRPSDSITAGYYLEYLIRIEKNKIKLNEIYDEHLVIPNVFSELYVGLYWCAENLKSGLVIAKQSLLKASTENPLYGFLFCCRHLISKINWKRISICYIWREFFKNLIKLTKDLTEVVGPIVNNSSPEGHIPNDFNLIDNYIDDLDTDDLTKPTTPQMILLCAWRTVKEVSLLLGEISLKAPLYRYDSDTVGLIKINEILEIGTHFTELLSETKHRGAFEQAYVGFSSLCQRLWSSSEIELHKLPFEWLKDLMEMITGEKTYNKLCSTRRSAGVPFMVQALITSELQVCSSKGLHYCMNNLLNLAKHGHTVETRTHSLNILRALYRCSDLGDTVVDYISDGLEIAIQGYDADSWLEQNSSTLLFSALMIRIFGVQRSRDTENLNIRNKMTGRIFFLRYPKLFDFFLTELQKAADVINKSKKKYRKLHPILLLLSRLYPSSLEGTESNLKLSRALPFIINCSSCPELQTRILIAKSIVVLISPDQISYTIHSIISILQQTHPNENSNLIHSLFLQIFYLLKSITDNAELTIILNNLKKLNLLDKNLIIIKLYLDIILEIAIKLREINLNFNNNFNLIIKNDLIIGHSNYLKSIILFKLLNEKKSNFIEKELNLNNKLEYNEIIINILIILLNINQDNFEITKNEVEIIKLKINEFNLNDILNNKIIGDVLIKLINKDNNYLLTVKSLLIISESNYFIKLFLNKSKIDEICDDNVLFITNLVNNNNNDLIKIAYFKIIYRILILKNSLFKDYDNKNKLLLILLKYISQENLDDLRKISTEILIVLITNEVNYKTINYENEIIKSNMILLLLKDDNEEIRELIGKCITNLVIKTDNSNNILLPLYLQKIYINFIYNNYKLSYGVTKTIVLFYILSGLEIDYINEIEDLDTDEITIKCFDKNEVNVFGEKFGTIFEIFKLIKDDLKDFKVEKFLIESDSFLSQKYVIVINEFMKSLEYKKLKECFCVEEL